MRRAFMFAVLFTALTLVSAANAGSASYPGRTSQGMPMSLTVASGRASGTVGLAASCGRLGTLRGVISFRNIPVGRRGWFGHRFAGTTNVSGWRDRWTAWIGGRTAGGTVTGRLFDRNVLLKGSSRAECRTGRVVWRATSVARRSRHARPVTTQNLFS